MNSMTGYGHASAKDARHQIDIEIRSVNQKALDINARMPKVFFEYENAMRTLIKEKIKRGRVDLYVSFGSEDLPSMRVDVNEELLQKVYSKMKDAWEKTCSKSFDDCICVSDLFRLPELITVGPDEGDEDILGKLLLEAMEAAMVPFCEMRRQEGANLFAELMRRLDEIVEIVERIELRAPIVAEEHDRKLREKLQEIQVTDALPEDRIATELVFFADKSDITEEITRLTSHISQFRAIAREEDPIGKKLDFLCQEMNREANTIGSKANDLLITREVVELKTTIEKIREQVQNVE